MKILFFFFYFMCKSLQILDPDGIVSKVSYLHTVQYSFPNQMWNSISYNQSWNCEQKCDSPLTWRLPRPFLFLRKYTQPLILWIFIHLVKVLSLSLHPLPSHQKETKLDNEMKGKSFLILIQHSLLPCPPPPTEMWKEFWNVINNNRKIFYFLFYSWWLLSVCMSSAQKHQLMSNILNNTIQKRFAFDLRQKLLFCRSYLVCSSASYIFWKSTDFTSKKL